MSTKAPNPIDKYVGSRVRMRRIMLGMSQEKLGEALGLTFQQVPVSFLFEGAPSDPRDGKGFGDAPSPNYVADFLATSEGLALTRAFTRIPDAKLRRSIVDLVEQIAAQHGA